MRELRTALGEDGLSEVTTYIQSGNVVFEAPETPLEALAERIDQVIDQRFGLSVDTVVVDEAALYQVLEKNPFSHEQNPKLVHVIFSRSFIDRAIGDELDTVKARKGAGEAFVIDGRVLYLHTPEGFGASEVAKFLLRQAAGRMFSGTSRNLLTVAKLTEMCGAPRSAPEEAQRARR